MTDPVIPIATKLAAKRGFIRTTAQAYAATLTTGISASVVLGVVTGTVELVPTLITLAVAVVSPFIAGAASYLSIIGSGVPSDYEDAALTKLSTLDTDEQEADINGAVSRTLRRDLRA